MVKIVLSMRGGGKSTCRVINVFEREDNRTKKKVVCSGVAELLCVRAETSSERSLKTDGEEERKEKKKLKKYMK